MKRIFPLFLVALILVFSLAPAAYAAETDDSLFFDVLGYSFPRESDASTVLGKNNRVTATFDLPSKIHVTYVDIVFRVDSSSAAASLIVDVSSAAGLAAARLSLVQIDDQLFRAYGSVGFTSQFLYFAISASSLKSVEFMSVRVCTTSVDGYDETGTCEITASDYYAIINYVPTDIINSRYWTDSSEPENNYLYLNVRVPNWRRYDFLEIFLSMDISSLTSIYARIGNKLIPCEISYLDNSGMINGHYNVAVRVDLTGADRTSTLEFNLTLDGSINVGSGNFVSVDGISGYIDSSSYNLVTAALRDIRSSLLSLVTQMSGAGTNSIDFKQVATNQSKEIDKAVTSMGAMTGMDMATEIGAINFTDQMAMGSSRFSGIFAACTSQSWVGSLVFSSLALGLISYILYGKR